MDNLHLAYLKLLGELGGSLDRLSDLSRKKVEAVRRDDLIALDEVLKQEQAMSLNLRGQELKRQKLLGQLGLDGVPLSALADHYPAELYPQAKEAAEDLRRSFRIYHSTAEVARSTLECNLHEMQKVIVDLGGDPAAGNGYASPNVEPPKNMKTDFRA